MGARAPEGGAGEGLDNNRGLHLSQKVRSAEVSCSTSRWGKIVWDGQADKTAEDRKAPGVLWGKRDREHIKGTIPQAQICKAN